MRVLLANIEEVFREAAARWILVAYFILSTLFILIFALSVNLDIVDGAIAGAELFGKSLDVSNPVNLQNVVTGFESFFSGVLFAVATFLAVFSTAHLVPRLQEKGTIDLYLSRPVKRVQLLLSRYIGGMLLAAANVFYLIGSMWLIVIWKTEVVHLRFMGGALIILFMISILLAFAFLIGVMTSSTAVSIMSTYAVYFISLILASHREWKAVLSSAWSESLVKGLYWFFPKSWEIASSTVIFVGGDRMQRFSENQNLTATYLSSAAFGILCLGLASWLFRRKEF